jgi:DNA-binding MarR family transcriptional regulator
MDFTKEQAVQQVASTTSDDNYYLTEGDQLPFRFCALPHTVIRDPYFNKDPLAFHVLAQVACFIALDQHQVVNGQKLKSGWSIGINQKSLATMLDIGRETLNRKLKALESEGYIESKPVGRNNSYRLTAYVVGSEQVRQMRQNASQERRSWQGEADGRVEGESSAQMKIDASAVETIKQVDAPVDTPDVQPDLFPVTTGSQEHPDTYIDDPKKNANCDLPDTQPVIPGSHHLIDNPLKDSTSSRDGSCDAEITASSSSPDLDQAKRKGLDGFVNAKQEINQSVSPGGRKRILTRDLDRFIAELCDAHDTVLPLRAMEILKRCTENKKLPLACPSNGQPIGSPTWYLNTGHETHLMPVLAEMGVVEEGAIVGGRVPASIQKSRNDTRALIDSMRGKP